MLISKQIKGFMMNYETILNTSQFADRMLNFSLLYYGVLLIKYVYNEILSLMKIMTKQLSYNISTT